MASHVHLLAQDHYRVGTVEGHEGLFVHIGDDVSYFRGKGRWRKNWRYRLTRNSATRLLMKAYDALPENVRCVLRGTPSRIWNNHSRKG